MKGNEEAEDHILNFLPPGQRSTVFLGKGQILNILGTANYLVSAEPSRLFQSSTKADIADIDSM